MQLVANPSLSYVHSPKESRQCYQSLERKEFGYYSTMCNIYEMYQGYKQTKNVIKKKKNIIETIRSWTLVRVHGKQGFLELLYMKRSSKEIAILIYNYL